MQPHQEPRFLVPLLVPVIVLVVNSGFIHRAGRVFLVGRQSYTPINLDSQRCLQVVYVGFNVALTILFGVLHQGGVVPSLFHVHDLVKHNQHSSIVAYWKTYMPPRHLLAIPATGQWSRPS